jgi:hypothetical protein
MTAALDDSVRKMICEDYDARNTCKAISEERGDPYKRVVLIVTVYRKIERVGAMREKAGRPWKMKRLMRGLMDDDI